MTEQAKQTDPMWERAYRVAQAIAFQTPDWMNVIDTVSKESEEARDSFVEFQRLVEQAILYVRQGEHSI